MNLKQLFAGRTLQLIAIVGVVIVFIGLQTGLQGKRQKPRAQQAQPTSQTAATPLPCSGTATPNQIEGPYYKAGSPQRTNIAENLPGEKIFVTGYVFDTNCQPIANAWLDFWQADASGVYDNTGFTLRGHQFTNASGKYTLETVVPGEYPGRTPHIHVKLRTDTGSIVTSQLYLPDASQNQSDSIFNQALVMKVTNDQNGKLATYDFVLEKR